MATTPTSTDLISRIPGARAERCQSCAKENGFEYNGHLNPPPLPAHTQHKVSLTTTGSKGRARVARRLREASLHVVKTLPSNRNLFLNV